MDQITATPGTDANPPEEPKNPRPVVADVSPAEWMKKNLFSTWYNALLTVLIGTGLAYALYRAFMFVFVNARWEAIRLNLTLLMVGLFPRPEIWRAWVALYVVSATIAIMVGATGRLVEEATPDDEAVEAEGAKGAARRLWPVGLLLLTLLSFSGAPDTIALVVGVLVIATAAYLVGRKLPHAAAQKVWWIGFVGAIATFAVLIWFDGIGWDDWGGLMLTLFLAIAAITLSFPFGVLAALGRRSSFPVIRIFSVFYIELIRGVPLITLLLMGSLGLTFFLPEGLAPGKVTRAVIMMTLFTGAYVAEIVRGGLQSVPKGQTEAGQAIGLPPTKITRRIVLPQALRNVIPALVGQFISLFKDTSLVTIIGLTDLLQVARNIIPGQPAFQGKGLLAETLVFSAFIYWVFAYTMSRESQRLEKKLGVGER